MTFLRFVRAWRVGVPRAFVEDREVVHFRRRRGRDRSEGFERVLVLRNRRRRRHNRANLTSHLR